MSQYGERSHIVTTPEAIEDMGRFLIISKKHYRFWALECERTRQWMRTTLYSPLNIKLRTLMKAARTKAGMTQAKMAKATGRTQAYISKFENGQLRLDVEDFIHFVRVLKIDPSEVIDELSK